MFFMTLDLSGHFLIATPAMGDRRFFRTVIYLCSHSAEGAFGLTINRPQSSPTMAEVLAGLSLEIPVGAHFPALRAGGPVETGRGFVLHEADEAGASYNASQPLPGGIALTASTDILTEIARGEAPSRWFLALGYAGWSPGQLESELAANAWLTCEADLPLVFDENPGEHQWRAALKLMGIDPLMLSATAGRA
jgi:putative transcriptional regulator